MMNTNTFYVVDPAIIKENEDVTKKAYEQEDFVLCFLLIHSLIESLLRTFLGKTGKESFNDLVFAYKKYMEMEDQLNLVFIKELTEFNRRRNRVIHQLWEKGYSATNQKLEPACRGAFLMYGLLIEWLETFTPEITGSGFEYDEE